MTSDFPAPVSVDEYRQLAQSNFQAFSARFKSLLPHDENGRFEPLERDPHELAQMLRATSASLKQLGIQPTRLVNKVVFAGGDAYTTSTPLPVPTADWAQLERDVTSAQSEDALVIFKAMTQAVKDHGCQERDWTSLVMKALEKPVSWRTTAIEAVPDFFLAYQEPHSTEPGDTSSPRPFHAIGTFVRSITSHGDEDHYATTLQTLQALKRIGVRDTVNPEDGCYCLHVAAWDLSPGSLRAFVEEFPAGVNVRSSDGKCPLHMAARSACPDNVKLLLDAGADSKPVDDAGKTPLDYAVAGSYYGNAIILLATLAYDHADVDRACAGSLDDDVVARVRAFHAAVMAGEIMDRLPGSLDHLRSL